MKKNLIKVACYCRVSTKSEEQEQSFEAQQEYFKEKLSYKNGYELVKIYADKGASGTDFSKREQFNEMLDECGIIKKEVKVRPSEIRKKYISIDYVVDADVTPKFNLIYVKDSSRFARNTEVSRIISRLREQGVFVYFEDLNKSTENPNEKMLIDFMFSMAEQESISRSTKVRFGNMQSAKDGIVRSMRLYGYTYNKKENSLRIIPEESEVVKLIFKLRLEGKGGRVIASILKDRGITNRQGNPWRFNTINSMLQNPVYCGKVARNRWYSSRMYGKDIVRLNNKEDWIVEDSQKVDKIIDEKIFNEVQDLIEDNRQKVGKQRGKYVGSSELAGKITCSKCFRKYTRNVDRGRVFYNCSNKKQNGTGACNGRNVQEYEIESLLEVYLEKGEYKKMSEKQLNCIIDRYEEKKATLYMFDENKNEIESIEQKISKCKNKLSKLLSIFLDDDSEGAKDVYENQKEAINKDITILERELRKLKITDKEKKEHVEKIESNIHFLNKLIQTLKEDISREEFIDECLDGIVVKEDGLYGITTSDTLFFMLDQMLKNNWELEELLQEDNINKVRESIR